MRSLGLKKSTPRRAPHLSKRISRLRESKAAEKIWREPRIPSVAKFGRMKSLGAYQRSGARSDSAPCAFELDYRIRGTCTLFSHYRCADNCILCRDSKAKAKSSASSASSAPQAHAYRGHGVFCSLSCLKAAQCHWRALQNTVRNTRSEQAVSIQETDTHLGTAFTTESEPTISSCCDFKLRVQAANEQGNGGTD